MHTFYCSWKFSLNLNLVKTYLFCPIFYFTICPIISKFILIISLTVYKADQDEERDILIPMPRESRTSLLLDLPRHRRSSSRSRYSRRLSKQRQSRVSMLSMASTMSNMSSISALSSMSHLSSISRIIYILMSKI